MDYLKISRQTSKILDLRFFLMFVLFRKWREALLRLCVTSRTSEISAITHLFFFEPNSHEIVSVR